MFKARPAMRLFNGQLTLDEAATKKVFLMHLGNVYAIKTYLVANLAKLAVFSSFPDIKSAILESIAEMKLQLLRMDFIYKTLQADSHLSQAMGVRAFSIETIGTLKMLGLTSMESDVIILLHLNMLEGIEISCYTGLYDLALLMPDNDIRQLIKENLDMATESRALYNLITREFLN